MHRLRILLIVAGVTAALLIAAIGIFVATFDPNSWKPRIQEAVLRATGRELSLIGPISLKWSLVPTIEARDVVLANIEGGSRPQMATAQSIEAGVALLPLLSKRIEISYLAVVKPDILIELTRDNRGNWLFGRPAASTATAVQAAAPGGSMAIDVKSVRVRDGTLTWHNIGTGLRVTTVLDSFHLVAPAETSPVTFDFVATYAGSQFTANGETGSMARLRDTAAATPWPVKLTVATGAAEVSVEAQSATPAEPASFSGTVSGKSANLAPLQPFVPRMTLPPVQGLSFSASIVNTGPMLARLVDVTLHTGVLDLSAYAPGLKLTHVDVKSPRLDQPAVVQAEGAFADAPLKIAATLGAPSALISGEPFPLDASIAVARATATAIGTLADPIRSDGAELLVSARIPTLAPFAALLLRPMPDLKDIAFDAHVMGVQGGFAKGFAVTQATLSLPQGDIAGDGSMTFTRPASIIGRVTSKRIDVDALLDVNQIHPQGPTAPEPLPAQRGNPNPLFSNAPLGLEVLRDVNADVQMHISQLRTGDQTDHDIDGHFVLRDGKLVLDPVSATLPSGRMNGRLSVDAKPPQPSVALELHAPGLSLRNLAQTLGLPSGLSGSLEVDANLHGAGTSPHAIAAGLNGTLGLALVNGEIDNVALNHLLGPILTSASLPLMLFEPGKSLRGVSALRCFAARLDAHEGLAMFRALYLDSTRVKVSGNGTINLATEALSLRLQPLARLAETGITVPLIIGGTIERPIARVDTANSAQANLTGLAQSAQNLVEVPLGVISGALGGPDRLSSGGDDCANQLSIARGGRGGPQPTSPPSLLSVPANAAKKILKAPKNLLQGLIGR